MNQTSAEILVLARRVDSLQSACKELQRQADEARKYLRAAAARPCNCSTGATALTDKCAACVAKAGIPRDQQVEMRGFRAFGGMGKL